MKALVRSQGETVRESDGILGIDWTTGAPLTNPAWCGGPYTLVENYVEEYPDIEIRPETRSSPKESEGAVTDSPGATPEDTPKVRTFVINGVEYTEQELKNLLIAE